MGGYKDEVATLRTELGRSSLGKAEISKQVFEQKEELCNANARVRELVGDLERKVNENDELKKSLTELRSAVASKEADSRSTMHSLQELQRVSSEEKAQLRHEIK